MSMVKMASVVGVVSKREREITEKLRLSLASVSSLGHHR